MKRVVALVLALSGALSAATSVHEGKSTMNDIAFYQYSEFPEKWALVTIRYRKDTGEMRLVYANDLAFRTLQSGSVSFPDGAVFAKTGIHTGPDEQFTSSVVPRGIRRYQLMVKDKTKYTATNGWGYALFDANGKTFPEDPVVAQDACYACHTIASSRGDVFSRPFNFLKNVRTPDFSPLPSEKLAFTWAKIHGLPDQIRKLLPKETKKLRLLKHTLLTANVFQGTLDELRPSLEEEARKSKAEVLFLSNDQKRFVLIVPEKIETCGAVGGLTVHATNLELGITKSASCNHD